MCEIMPIGVMLSFTTTRGRGRTGRSIGRPGKGRVSMGTCLSWSLTVMTRLRSLCQGFPFSAPRRNPSMSRSGVHRLQHHYFTFFGFDIPPWWCPNYETLKIELISKTKDHQWLWQDAWSTAMECFSIWGMRGWQLERAGHWKLFPDWSKKLTLEIMALYQDGNISNHLQSTG